MKDYQRPPAEYILPEGDVDDILNAVKAAVDGSPPGENHDSGKLKDGDIKIIKNYFKDRCENRGPNKCF